MPPRWAEALLEWLLPPGLRTEALLGDLEEDLAAHVAAGATTRAARRRYIRQALGIALRWAAFRVTDSHPRSRDDRSMLRALADDLRHAFRSLAHAPGFMLLAVLTLGAGVGATTAIFSVVNGVLLRPLPYPDGDQLVAMKVDLDGREMTNHSEPEFLDYQREVKSFSSVAAWRYMSLTLGSTAEPERIRAVAASASLLPLLGTEPALGRVFTPEEDAPGAASVIVLSHALWVRAFGADPGVVGREVVLEDKPTTVVGVMPQGFAFPDEVTQAWRPLGIDRVDPWGRNNHYLSILARLAPGVSLDAARSELSALATRSAQTYPDTYGGPIGFNPYRYRDLVVGDVRSPLLFLLGAVLAVLLIASVNAAALFLARGEARRGEIAVRSALGAGRGRVVGQLMAESLLVALSAAMVGSGLAWAGVVALRALAPTNLPRLDRVVMDGRVLAFGVGVAVLTGLVFGMAPALQALREDVRDVLAGGGRGGIGSRGAGRFRRGLVVVQLSLATILALGAGLLIRSFQELRHVDLGFQPHGVLDLSVLPSTTTVPEDTAAVAFYASLLERIRALPGVTAAGASLRVPLIGGHDNYSIQVEGHLAATTGDAPAPGINYVTPGYFRAMGIALREGRLFTDADRVGAPLVAMVNARLAAELWPNEDPLGKRVRMYPEGNPWMEVVGVVADVKHYGIQEEASTKLYVPHAQAYVSAYYAPNQLDLLVRTDGDASALAGPVRAVAREVGPNVPLRAPRTMDDVVDSALSRERFTLLLLGAFAAVALLLAAVGVYGVVARAVSARTREIGLRMAVGADRSDIARSVLREGVTLAVVGCGVGVVGGAALSGVVRVLLFGVSPLDPWTYLIAVPLLALTTAVACAVPAVRAARLDPVHALRE